MDAKYIIQEGDIAKYQLNIKHEDFDMMQDDFDITLSWGMLNESMVVKKEEMFFDEEGHWFFMFNSTGMIGKVMSTCHYWVTDSDMKDGKREEYDRQYIGFVTKNPCPQLDCCCTCPQNEDNVVYTRVFRNDANTLYLNLRTTEDDGEHRPLHDVNGQQMRVKKEEKDIH